MAKNIDILFYTAGLGRCEKFVVPYTVCILESNPNSAVEVLVKNVDTWGEILNAVNDVYPGALHLREAPDGVHPKFCRWLTEPHNYGELTYIGDIDIAIVEYNVYQWHKNNMAKLGLPYSNVLRDESPPRMSGLHCVRTKDWYTDKWHQATSNYLSQNLKPGTGRDERLLAKIAKEVTGCYPPVWHKDVVSVFDNKYRPQHGIHFSLGREKKERDKGFGHNEGRIDSLLKIQKSEGWKKLSKYIDSSVFSISKLN